MYYLRDGLGVAEAGLDLRADRRRGRADHHALHTAQLDRGRPRGRVLDEPAGCRACCIAVLTWLVIIGGVKSIGRAVEKLSPLKVALYLAGGLFVIVVNAGQLPAVLASVFREAFSLRAATGTAAGMALMVGMRYGLARGVYANEAGYGTAAVAYGTAQSDRPGAAGAERRHRGVRRLVRHLVDQRPDDPRDRRLDERPEQHGGRRARVQQRDPGGGRLDRGVLRVPVRLHDADRVGVLRRAVLRVHPRACA